MSQDAKLHTYSAESNLIIDKMSAISVWNRYKNYGYIVLISSIFLNIIVFSGSIYMMLIYDSIIPSHSKASLFGLFLILILIYAFQAIFENIRSEAMLGVANGIHDDLYRDVHFATSALARNGSNRGTDGLQLTRDLDQVHAFLTGQGPIALIDLPWVILFMGVLASLHWALGLTALVGTLALLILTGYTNRCTSSGSEALNKVLGARSAATLQEIRFAESAAALGMQANLLKRSLAFEGQYIANQSVLSRTMLRLGSVSRIFRMLLQSSLLTVGAMLVMSGDSSGGVILASSVLSGRALAPIDTTIANWRGLTAARSGWDRLHAALSANRASPHRITRLPRPSGAIVLRDVWLTPSGSTVPVISGVSLSLKPGQALAVIGASAAGKTSLIKAIAGIWSPARGEIRVAGATYDQWSSEEFGQAVGYVPQTVDLLEGTVSENIARFQPQATSESVIQAAMLAEIHDAILALPNGYDTVITSTGGELSSGQRQRIGLARALFGDPFVLLLDEANSNLDAAGDQALANAIEVIKARQGIVVMVTHRPSTLGPATHVAVMAGGRLVEFGPRDEVLKKHGLVPPTAARGFEASHKVVSA